MQVGRSNGSASGAPGANGREGSRAFAMLAALVLFWMAFGLHAAIARAQVLRPPDVSRDEAIQQLEEQSAREVEAYARESGISEDQAADRLRHQTKATTKLVDYARRDLGAAFGGVWINPKTGRVKLGLASGYDATKADASAELRAAGLADGADVVSVKHSEGDLQRVSEWLTAELDDANDGAVSRIVFGARTDDNAVVVQLPAGRDVTRAQQDVVARARDIFGDAIVVDEYNGTLAERVCSGFWCSAPLRGGQPLTDASGGAYCTGSWVSIGRGPNKFLFETTAGHCAVLGQNVYTWLPSTLQLIGPYHNKYYGHFGDAAAIKHTNYAVMNPQPWVYVRDHPTNDPSNDEYKIRNVADPVVGQIICTSGAFYGHNSCGTVSEVDHWTGFMGGLVRGSFCGVGGDSGAPMWKYETAYGMQIAGYSQCDSLAVRSQVTQDLTNTDIARWLLP